MQGNKASGDDLAPLDAEDPYYSGITENIPVSTVDSPSVVLELIYQLKIRDVMNPSVITIGKSETLRKARVLMKENNLSGLPVMDNHHLLGLISMEDVILALEQGCIDSAAEEKMHLDFTALEADMPLSFAINWLNKSGSGSFPVLNKKKELAGIISSDDVIRILLLEMNREIQRLEKIREKTVTAPVKTAQMVFNVSRHNFEHAGRASTDIKKALKIRNLDPAVIRRAAIASYELEINLVVHSLGGTIGCTIHPDRVIITAADTGPGITDIDLALQEGWSTADSWIRSLGFGAGMGLANTKRVSDEFRIESAAETGTSIRSVIFFEAPGESENG